MSTKLEFLRQAIEQMDAAREHILEAQRTLEAAVGEGATTRRLGDVDIQIHYSREAGCRLLGATERRAQTCSH